jgi:hypothetical protein
MTGWPVHDAGLRIGIALDLHSEMIYASGLHEAGFHMGPVF